MPICSKTVQNMSLVLMARMYMRLNRLQGEPEIIHKLHKVLGSVGKLISCIDNDPNINIEGLKYELRYIRKHHHIREFQMLFYSDRGWFVDQIIEITQHLRDLCKRRKRISFR